MRRLDVGYLEHGKAIASRNRSRISPLHHSECLCQQSGAVRQPGYNAILCNVVSCDYVQAPGGSSLLQAVLLGISGQLRRERLHRGTGTLLLENGDNLCLYFGERAKVRGLLILHLQDVKAELRLDQVRSLSRCQRERGLVELRDRLAAIQPAQLTALGFAARVIGELRRQARQNCRPP